MKVGHVKFQFDGIGLKSDVEVKW